ncbi:abortive phage infection protein [Serinibacter arcticus]|uniref:Abortive phage infection protein n=2 Tax=Serinibacter arcticus TaxID=1655435 RepID=A0A2U2A075_9MICO|nr:CPBP family glutamic-type intramembrane protease [Serinibacter arcticus]PWD52616.1 abortive phage infection protein [Serinibacter arcticus]
MAMVSASAVALLVMLERPAGWALLAAGVGLAVVVDRVLARTLTIVAVGLVALSSINLAADLTNAGIARFAVVLSFSVVVPALLARRFVARDAVTFPLRTGQRWSRPAWLYLIFVVVAGYLILPAYFLRSGAYLNWPAIETGNEIGRLFLGVNAVGIWDELFFVCIVFALYRRHVPLWLANVLQAVVFVSFLWELGYRSWGPLLTIPFALIQGWTFALTKSLTYVVTVHLLFDAVVFMVLVHAHNPHLFDIFITAPW